MTAQQLKDILDRVLTWPPDRQEDAARLLAEMEQQATNPHRLTDEQLDEVRQRRLDFASGKERYATDEEAAAVWKKSGL